MKSYNAPNVACFGGVEVITLKMPCQHILFVNIYKNVFRINWVLQIVLDGLLGCCSLICFWMHTFGRSQGQTLKLSKYDRWFDKSLIHLHIFIPTYICTGIYLTLIYSDLCVRLLTRFALNRDDVGVCTPRISRTTTVFLFILENGTIVKRKQFQYQCEQNIY